MIFFIRKLNNNKTRYFAHRGGAKINTTKTPYRSFKRQNISEKYIKDVEMHIDTIKIKTVYIVV